VNRAPVAPVRLNPSVAPRLEEIINKLLEKDRDLRYQSAAELRGDLKRLKRDTDSGRTPVESSTSATAASSNSTLSLQSSGSVPISSSSAVLVETAKRHKLSLGMTAVLLLVIIGAAAFGAYSLFFAPRALPFQSIKTTRVSATRGARLSAMSPDGKYLAYVINEDGNEGVWLRHIASDSNVRIVPAEHVQYNALRFSPDGSYLYFTHTLLASGPESQSFDLYRIPVLGGTQQLLSKDVDSTPSFSPDGKRMVLLRANDPEPGKTFLLIANADGSDEKVIFKGDAGHDDFDPDWSPDGSVIAGARPYPTPEAMGTLISADPLTGAEKVWMQSSTERLDQARWMPDGRAMLVLSANADTDFDRDQIGLITYPGGTFHAITSDTNNYNTLSVSSDGTTLATILAQVTRDVYLIQNSHDYSDAKQITSGDPAKFVSWSKDSIVFSQNSQIFAADSHNDAHPSSALFHAKFVNTMCGCPDGRIIFAQGSPETRTLRLWRSEADGTGLHQLSNGRFDTNPECSPDSKWIYYAVSDTRTYARVSIDGGTPEMIRDEAETRGGIAVSPDASMLLLGTYDFKVQRPNITLMDANTKKVIRILQYDPRHIGRLRFAPDGKGIVYPIRDKGIDNLWIQPLDGSPGHQLTHFTALKIYSYDWSHDGKSLALVRGDSPTDLVLIRDAQKH
jgi:Tol biopolymer transport system component